jgi:hypothetical protein
MKIYRSKAKNCTTCKRKLEPDLKGICLDCMSTYNAHGHYPAYESDIPVMKDSEKLVVNVGMPRVSRNFR